VGEFTLVSDTFPRRVVASVAGIGGFAGSVSGTVIATATEYLWQVQIVRHLCTAFEQPSYSGGADPTNDHSRE
jgi:hypothetical protein